MNAVKVLIRNEIFTSVENYIIANKVNFFTVWDQVLEDTTPPKRMGIQFRLTRELNDRISQQLRDGQERL